MTKKKHGVVSFFVFVFVFDSAMVSSIVTKKERSRFVVVLCSFFGSGDSAISMTMGGGN